MTLNLVTIRVWGDFACFTRPEMKVERVSYPVMTPSAARGVLEAIFWEPQMYYLIDSIRIVKRGRWISIRRNEITKVISISNAKSWMRAPDKAEPIVAGGGAEDGTQRNMLALQDVEYLITAEVRTTTLANRPEDKVSKYLGEIERRARIGKCYHRPGMGMREFDAQFEWESDAKAAHVRRASELGVSVEHYNEDLGIILYDVFDRRERATGFKWSSSDELLLKTDQKKKLSKDDKIPWEGHLISPQPAFFHAKVISSVLECHPERVHILSATNKDP